MNIFLIKDVTDIVAGSLRKITYTLQVEKKAEKDIETVAASIKEEAQDKEITIYLDLTVLKTTHDHAGNLIDEVQLHELGDNLEITIKIPDELKNRRLFLYRYHDGMAETLPQADKEDEYFVKDGEYLILHVKKFSIYAIGVPVSEDMDYMVTYELNGGKNHEDNPKTYGASSHFELKAPVKEGYHFMGWYQYADFSGNPIIKKKKKKSGDLTLYAKWELNQYTVIYEDKLNETTKEVAIAHGQKLQEPHPPTREGYRFLGWYCGEEKWNFEEAVSKDMTLQARWEKLTIEEEKPGQSTDPSIPSDSKDDHPSTGTYQDVTILMIMLLISCSVCFSTGSYNKRRKSK